jgi:predicted metal-dependent phosphoesterase TrpH
MNLNLVKYKITPFVVEIGVEQTIKVKGIDTSSRFFDDVTYEISIYKTDGYGYKEGFNHRAGGRDICHKITANPVDGEISFSHVYDNEGEWEIRIQPLNVDNHTPERFVKYWPAGKNRMLQGVAFRIYALKSDLYSLKAYKGDFHVHSFESDGLESPELVVARYRKEGYDVMAITDHYFMQPSFDVVEYFKDFNGGIKLFPGEEVHPWRNGEIFHVVNLNGKVSVNELYNSEPEKANAEIAELAKTFDLENQVDNYELAFFKWIFDKIREGGGIAIYPHAYWHVAVAENVRREISHEILKRKLCDAYEIFGGMSIKDNRLMTQLYTELRAQGVDLPIVGSSDAHSTLRGDLHFNDFFTIAFAKDKESVVDSIMEKRTVVVDNINKGDKVVYGDLRLVRYAYFLLENYFGTHDELCNSVGQALTRYVLGDKEEKALVEELEKKVLSFEKEFFGR